jgi:hypothetical protein
MTGPGNHLTTKQALIFSSVALLALADTLEEQGVTSISVEELRERAKAELVYFNEL